MPPGETWALRQLVALLDATQGAAAGDNALEQVARAGNSWALERLLRRLRERGQDHEAQALLDSEVERGTPVKEDSVAWATTRMIASGAVFLATGLGAPKIFEFPHYAASPADYEAVNALFGKRYDRGLYFPGVLTGGKYDYARQFGQFFPYTVEAVKLKPGSGHEIKQQTAFP